MRLSEMMTSAYDTISPWAKGRPTNETVTALVFIAMDQLKDDSTKEDVMAMFEGLYDDWRKIHG